MILRVKNIKVPAFTMIDMITGMVIMSIVISLVFYVFSSLNKQVHEYTNSRSDVIALNLFKTQLDQNFATAEKIIELPNGFAVLTPSSRIEYRLNGSEVIRTIGIDSESIFNGVDKIKYVNDKTSINDEERIRDIVIELLVEKKKMKLYLYKKYGNEERINRSILNEIN